jgi:YVTN family beta-propeller protein
MSFRSVARLAALVIPTLVCMACGQIYRPVVIPCSEGGISGCPTEPPAVPANFHAVFAITANVPNSPGGAMQIDVAGDSIAAETPSSFPEQPNLGNIPTHAAVFPNNAIVFVASAGSLVPGGLDVVSSFNPATQSRVATGFGTVNNVILPSGSLPVFLNTTQNGTMYVANFGTNSVSSIDPTLNVVSNTAPVGTNPVALAETPNGLKIYVANQGSNTISSLNALDLSPNVVTGFTGVTPVWVVARSDSQKVYIVTQGDGQLVTIDTATDTVTSSLPVGAGANFVFYDPNLNRLYVTNPSTDVVYVFSDTGGTNAGVANDTPVQLAAISLASGSVPCPTGCTPESVAALPDGSRFYVATYQTASPCPDTLAGSSSSCIIPEATVLDANNFTVKTTLTLLTDPPFAANLTTNQYQYAVPPVTSCVPAASYAPGTTRFRVFTVASVDSSRVYVGMCDAGAIAVINTTGSNTNNPGGGTPADTVVTDLPAAFSAGRAQANGEPALQNPIFMLTGQ